MIYRTAFGLPSWNFRSAFDELNRMRRQMDRLFEGIPDRSLSGYSGSVFPAMNLTEDKDYYIIRAELPGIASSELNIEATGRNLSITGERKIPAPEEGAKYHRREREAGRFARAISLPGEIDAAKVEASLKNGILTVKLPKAAASKPRQITIN
ncbi:MAG: Hsp20/alpha crystallin family protein [Desulfobacterales bacterium]|nr:Hsp20/alpha crystallin family protein [Desulfobacterales bacterium]